ncbi:hypothetical protein KDN24_18665 [Bacillus sp. Bva_UNVM-123]|uniref:hypothetical protein n=1 Tax=Bacillus sp. Bva_UNVM-123 TaxID=2829798 RepID=UPI00391F470B
MVIDRIVPISSTNHQKHRWMVDFIYYPLLRVKEDGVSEIHTYDALFSMSSSYPKFTYGGLFLYGKPT